MQPKRSQQTSVIEKDDLLFLVMTIGFCSVLFLALPSLLKADGVSMGPQRPLISTPLPSTTVAGQPMGSASVARPSAMVFPVIGVCWGLPDDEPHFFIDKLDIRLPVAAKRKPLQPVLNANIPFHDIINRAAGRYQVDPHLIRAIILAESGFNPRATSQKGASGLMQLMPTTAKSLGVKDVYDPKENIDGGVRYFKKLLERFDGDVQLALAAYNAGSRHVRNYEGVPPFKATRLYIEKVLRFYQQFKAEMNANARKLADGVDRLPSQPIVSPVS